VRGTRGDSYRLREKKKAGLLGRKKLAKSWRGGHDFGEQGSPCLFDVQDNDIGLDRALSRSQGCRPPRRIRGGYHRDGKTSSRVIRMERPKCRRPSPTEP